MSADSDPPGDTIVVGGTYETSEDEGITEDDGLDIYSDDEHMQDKVNEPVATDEPAVAANDAYAQSFDSPIAEGDASPAQDEGELPAATLPWSSADLNNPMPDQPKQEAPPASSDSDELSSPSLSSPEPNETPTAVPEALPVSAQPPGVDGPPREPSPQAQLQPVTDPVAAPVPKPLYQSNDFPGNDANLALDIQELVNDIRAASPSASSSSDSSRQMQLDAESPAAAPLQGPIEHGAANPVPDPPSSSGSKPANAAPSEPQTGEEQQQAVAAQVPALANDAPPPTGPAASTHPVSSGKKTTGGGNKGGGRGGKNGAQLPPVGPSTASLSREPPSGPKGQSGSRQGHNARNSGPQTWDMFVADERRYTAEAKWEKFPEGSRIFVGNLSQERVSKKEVFALFHKYGRLAQISLKPAYGFVQYHTAAEAAEAIRHLQNIDVRGRKINLEVSKTQKKSGKDRDRSPDRNKKSGRKGDSYDGREAGRNTDGYRPNYEAPSRRSGDRYSNDHGRGRHGERGRSRSRSPRPYSRSEDHRQRSPPRGDSHPYAADSDRGARSQNIVPDAQILQLQEVHKDFVQYVQRAFSDRGLRTDVMYVDPRFLDSVVQRLIVDGAHAVVKVDLHSQGIGKVALQTFNRTPGTMHVGFDEYRDLDTNVAAELVLQTKRRSQTPVQQQQPTAYQPPPQLASGYPQAYPTQMYTGYPINSHTPAQAAAPVLPGAIGQVDPSLLQKVLMSLQGQQPQAGAIPQIAFGAPAQPPVPGFGVSATDARPPALAAAAPQQYDINAILSNLKNASAAPAARPVPASYGAPSYPVPGAGVAAPGPMSPTGPPPSQAGMSTSQQVQDIMAQLSRYR